MAEPRTPREPQDHEYTGTGTTRSSDSSGTQREGGLSDTASDIDPAIITGATTSSDPSDAAGLAINRSGSGGSGDEQNDEDDFDPPAA